MAEDCEDELEEAEEEEWGQQVNDESFVGQVMSSQANFVRVLLKQEDEHYIRKQLQDQELAAVALGHGSSGTAESVCSSSTRVALDGEQNQGELRACKCLSPVHLA